MSCGLPELEASLWDVFGGLPGFLVGAPGGSLDIVLFFTLWSCSGHLLPGVAGFWVVVHVPVSPLVWSQCLERVFEGRVNGVVGVVVGGRVLLGVPTLIGGAHA